MAEVAAANKDGSVKAICLSPCVCKTPMGSSMVPVPYMISYDYATAKNASTNVNFGGVPAIRRDGYLPTVVGNEAGVGGGIVSGVNKGYVNMLEHSSTVNVNGLGIVRHGDEIDMNADTPNVNEGKTTKPRVIEEEDAEVEDLSKVTLAKVAVRYRELTSYDGVYHAYIVVYDLSGEEHIYRAGPSSLPNANSRAWGAWRDSGNWGQVIATTGEKALKEEMTPRGVFRPFKEEIIEKLHTQEEVGFANALLIEHSIWINETKTKYKPKSVNSNTYVKNAIYHLKPKFKLNPPVGASNVPGLRSSWKFGKWKKPLTREKFLGGLK